MPWMSAARRTDPARPRQAHALGTGRGRFGDPAREARHPGQLEIDHVGDQFERSADLLQCLGGRLHVGRGALLQGMQPVHRVPAERIDQEGGVARVGPVRDEAQGAGQSVHAREDLQIAGERDEEHLARYLRGIEPVGLASSVEGFEHVAQRALDRFRHAQRARDLARHLAVDLGQRADGACEFSRGAGRCGRQHGAAPADVIAEQVGKLGRVRRATRPAQQRDAGRVALDGGIAAGRGRELRCDPCGARRVVDGLAHAQVADEGERLDGVEDRNGVR